MILAFKFFGGLELQESLKSIFGNPLKHNNISMECG